MPARRVHGSEESLEHAAKSDFRLKAEATNLTSGNDSSPFLGVPLLGVAACRRSAKLKADPYDTADNMPSRGVLWWDFDGTLVSRPMMWSEVAMRLLDRYSPGHAVTRDVMDAQVSQGMPWHRTDHAHPELSSPALWWEAVSRRYAGIFETLAFQRWRQRRRSLNFAATS